MELIAECRVHRIFFFRPICISGGAESNWPLPPSPSVRPSTHRSCRPRRLINKCVLHIFWASEMSSPWHFMNYFLFHFLEQHTGDITLQWFTFWYSLYPNPILAVYILIPWLFAAPFSRVATYANLPRKKPKVIGEKVACQTIHVSKIPGLIMMGKYASINLSAF